MSEQQEQEPAPQVAAGQVKWFDPAKGFGFIRHEEGQPDILLHVNVLRNFGQGTVAEGARVVVRAVPTPRGFQAVDVLSIDPPAETASGASELSVEDRTLLAGMPFVPARVKWFDKAKGFGFANVFGAPGDVFLHIEVLRQGGFADLAAGEAVAVKVIDGRRGLMAGQLGSWEQGLRSGATVTQLRPEGPDPLPARPTAPPPSPISAEALAQPPLLVAGPEE